jgi:preprotein translocase subunit SecE
VGRLTDFVREAWQELKRVHWPTRRETYAATGVVVLVVIFFAIYLGLVDILLSYIRQWLLR